MAERITVDDVRTEFQCRLEAVMPTVRSTLRINDSQAKWLVALVVSMADDLWNNVTEYDEHLAEAMEHYKQQIDPRGL